MKANLMGIQEIFVNPSPFRRRQKVTDVKSDGLPNKKKNYSTKYTFVYAVFTTPNNFCYRFLAFLITQTFLRF